MPRVAQRDHMEESQAGKRPMEPSSLPLPSPARARTSSPRVRPQEPLSFLAEHVSAASRVVANPVFMTHEIVRQEGRPVEFFRPVQLPRAEEPPEPRLNVSMTLSEYERMINTFQASLDEARALGQGQGAQAMNEIVVQMSQLIDRLFQEGRQLQQRHDQLEVLLNAERRAARDWLETTKNDLQMQAKEFVNGQDQVLRKQYEEDKTKMLSEFERERLAQTMASERKLEEFRNTVSEDFRRQQAEAQAHMQTYCQKFAEDCNKEAAPAQPAQSNCHRHVGSLFVV